MASDSQRPTRSDSAKGDLARLFHTLPPQAPEAEMSLLGSMILAGTENIHLIGQVMQALRGPSDFFLPKHGLLYQSILELYDKHQSVDTVQLVQSLRDRGLVESVGGVDYLVQLAESVSTALHGPRYAQIVRDKARLRLLINAAGEILREAHESSEPAGLILDNAEKRIFEIAQADQTGEPAPLSELVREAFARLEERQEKGGTSLTGLNTGFETLNELLGGFQPGEMLILAARPSLGKTALALNFAEHMAVDHKQPVLVFSLEMGRQQLADRLLSARSGVDSHRMRRNTLSAQEIQHLQEAAGQLSEAPIFVDDTPGLTVLEMRAKSRRMASRHSIKAIVIDYLQLMSCPGQDHREQEVSAISRGVKALARELHVPVICLSQLNRNPEGRETKRPMLSDLRESGSIEQDADVVMLLHREEYYHTDAEWIEKNPDKKGLAEIIIAKQRNGPTGSVPLQFDGRTTRFLTRAPYDIPEPAPF